jgi:hypothetical protein
MFSGISTWPESDGEKSGGFYRSNFAGDFAAKSEEAFRAVFGTHSRRIRSSAAANRRSSGNLILINSCGEIL